jgi:hypothetical protein
MSPWRSWLLNAVLPGVVAAAITAALLVVLT